MAVDGGAERVDCDKPLQCCNFECNVQNSRSTHANMGGVGWGGGQRDTSNLFLTRHNDVNAWAFKNKQRVNHVIGNTNVISTQIYITQKYI